MARVESTLEHDKHLCFSGTSVTIPKRTQAGPGVVDIDDAALDKVRKTDPVVRGWFEPGAGLTVTPVDVQPSAEPKAKRNDKGEKVAG